MSRTKSRTKSVTKTGQTVKYKWKVRHSLRQKMQCLRLLNKNVLDVLDSKTSYKSIGSFKTRREAEEALANYYMNPIDYAGKIETFEQLYEA